MFENRQPWHRTSLIYPLAQMAGAGALVEIRAALGPVGKRTLSAALKDTPPPEWTRRPNAKDDLREKASTEGSRAGHQPSRPRSPPAPGIEPICAPGEGFEPP